MTVTGDYLGMELRIDPFDQENLAYFRHCAAVDRAAAIDRRPDRVWMAAPRAGGGRRVAQQVARRAALQVELAR